MDPDSNFHCKRIRILYSNKNQLVLKNIKIIDDDDKLIVEDSDINELYKKLCTSNINE